MVTLPCFLRPYHPIFVMFDEIKLGFLRAYDLIYICNSITKLMGVGYLIELNGIGVLMDVKLGL